MKEMTVIPDPYTMFRVNTRTESNQGWLLKFYSTVSGLSQKWFSANVETPVKYEAFLP
jgi:hypothetical protein